MQIWQHYNLQFQYIFVSGYFAIVKALSVIIAEVRTTDERYDINSKKESQLP